MRRPGQAHSPEFWIHRLRPGVPVAPPGVAGFGGLKQGVPVAPPGAAGFAGLEQGGQ